MNNRLCILILLLASGLVASWPGRAGAHAFDNTPNPDKALDAYKKMADDNPDDVELQYEYAEILVAADKLDDAEQVIFSRVTAKNPDYDLAYYLLSEIYFRQQKFEKALEPLQKIKDKDTNADALIAEATIYLKLENPKKCMEKARRALKVDPKNSGGQLHVGLAYLKMGDTKKGMRHLEISLRMNPNQPMVYEWLRQLYKENLTPARQIKKLEIIAADVPEDSDLAIRVRTDIKELEKLMEKKDK